MEEEKKKVFRRLSREAQTCRFCPQMADQTAVLGPGNGCLNAEVLFIAEAPGRLGAGRTGIPFQGDRSGENFECLIRHIGLTRDKIFITNAALCNPLSEGSNRRPTAKEIRNCSHYLQATLSIIQPRIVVTLGSVALQAINLLNGSRYELSRNVARPVFVNGFTLFPLYHPSPRVTNWKRTLKQQKRDFMKILKALKDGEVADKTPALK